MLRVAAAREKGKERKEKKTVGRLWPWEGAGKARMNSRATVARRGRRERGRETYGPRWVGEGGREGPCACKGQRKGFIAWLCSLLTVTGQVYCGQCGHESKASPSRGPPPPLLRKGA